MSSPHDEVEMSDAEALVEHFEYLSQRHDPDWVIKIAINWIQQKRNLMDAVSLKRRMNHASR